MNSTPTPVAEKPAYPDYAKCWDSYWKISTYVHDSAMTLKYLTTTCRKLEKALTKFNKGVSPPENSTIDGCPDDGTTGTAVQSFIETSRQLHQDVDALIKTISNDIHGNASDLKERVRKTQSKINDQIKALEAAHTKRSANLKSSKEKSQKSILEADQTKIKFDTGNYIAKDQKNLSKKVISTRSDAIDADKQHQKAATAAADAQTDLHNGLDTKLRELQTLDQERLSTYQNLVVSLANSLAELGSQITALASNFGEAANNIDIENDIMSFCQTNYTGAVHEPLVEYVKCVPRSASSPSVAPGSVAPIPVYNASASSSVAPTNDVAYTASSLSQMQTPSSKTATAEYDFSAMDSSQLSMREGDKFTIIDEADGWYLARNKNGQEGYIPANHVSV